MRAFFQVGVGKPSTHNFALVLYFKYVNYFLFICHYEKRNLIDWIEDGDLVQKLHEQIDGNMHETVINGGDGIKIQGTKPKVNYASLLLELGGYGS